MALELTFEAKSGTFPEAYLRVNGISIDTVGQTAIIHLATYVDEAAFDDGKAPVDVSNVNVSTDDYATVVAAPASKKIGLDAVARAYVHLKKQEQFAAAKDC